jgi:CRP/FNR family transcriptional regulator, cyclic AMP receptor protein
VIDASGFFEYPTEPPAPSAPQLLGAHSERDWTTFLAYTETRRFRRGDAVLGAGEVDRALYLLVDGRLERPCAVVEPVTTVCESAFLDGGPRTVTFIAITDGELLRLGWDAFEALAAREPQLARDALVDLGRILAARLRGTPGWSG